MAFERFSDRARRIVVLSQEEATELGHNYIGTEHLLLAMIREGEGIAAQVLTGACMDLEGARECVKLRVESGVTPSGHIPFDHATKKVFEMAMREALQLGHNWIGTEHLLLGLLRLWDDETIGAVILKEDYGLDRHELKRAVKEALGINVRKGSYEDTVWDDDRHVVKTATDRLTELAPGWRSEHKPDGVTITLPDDGPLNARLLRYTKNWPYKVTGDRLSSVAAVFVEELERALRLGELDTLIHGATQVLGAMPVLVDEIPIVDGDAKDMLNDIVDRAKADAKRLGYDGFDTDD